MALVVRLTVMVTVNRTINHTLPFCRAARDRAPASCSAGRGYTLATPQDLGWTCLDALGPGLLQRHHSLK